MNKHYQYCESCDEFLIRDFYIYQVDDKVELINSTIPFTTDFNESFYDPLPGTFHSNEYFKASEMSMLEFQEVLHDCPVCGYTPFEVDEYMVIILRNLWNKGIATHYSCAGHIKSSYHSRENDMSNLYINIDRENSNRKTLRKLIALIEECDSGLIIRKDDDRDKVIIDGIEDDEVNYSSSPIIVKLYSIIKELL